MTITLKQLRKAKACAEQVTLFWKTFGKSVTLTHELVTQHGKNFYLSWIVERFFPAPLYAKYLADLAPLDAKYDSDLAPLEAKYLADLALLYAKYDSGRAPFDAKYLADRAPFDAKYLADCAPFDAKYLADLGVIFWTYVEILDKEEAK